MGHKNYKVHRGGGKKYTAAQKTQMFYDRLNKTDGPTHPVCGQCWVLRRTDGSGRLCTHRSSRQAWEIQVGHIPDGLQVLHKCDNPPCCNPEHLFLGTISDNIRDAQNKGRKIPLYGNQHALGHKQSDTARQTKAIKGKSSWANRRKNGTDGFKISQEQVQDIRRRYKRESYLVSNAAELAAEFGVKVGQIHKIVRGAQRKSPDAT